MSSALLPESEFSALVDELNTYRLNKDWSEFDIVRLKKKAINIKENVDLAEGFALLGMIACLENDKDMMVSYSEIAIQQSGREPFHMLNYSKSLHFFNLKDDSYKYALMAYSKNPADPEFLEWLIHLSAELNKTQELLKYNENWYKLTGEKYDMKNFISLIYVNEKECREFIDTHANSDKLPDGHLSPETVLSECIAKMIDFFSVPLKVVLEIMPDSSHKPNLVSWIQWFGDMNDGMERYDRFENWYIENDYDLKTDLINFNIEFVGQQA